MKNEKYEMRNGKSVSAFRGERSLGLREPSLTVGLLLGGFGLGV
jgi:hypothetical protein